MAKSRSPFLLSRIRKQAATQLRVGRALLRHDRTPRASKVLLAAAIAYLVMPFDLVPDWIPILGQLDDVVVIAVLVSVAWLLVPEDVRRECRLPSDGVQGLEERERTVEPATRRSADDTP